LVIGDMGLQWRHESRAETIIYYVRATDPASNKQVAYECAKTAELRMSGFSDVVMSIPKADDNETRP